MGLQIWLPLNGNIENKGLSNIAVTQFNTTIDTNGKIGSCYSFNGTDSGLSISNAPVIKEWTESTVCFWIKNAPAGKAQCIINHRTSVGNGLAVFLVSNKIRIDSDGVSSCSFSDNYNFDNWTHVAIISKGTERILYLNGELKEVKTVSKTPVYTQSGTYASIGGSTTNTATLGGNWLQGLLNDFRLYDEALSPMQIKLISQGLVAHYLLNNNNGGLPNILKGVPRVYNKTSYTVYNLEMLNNFEVGKTYTVQLWNINVSHTGKTADELGMSVYWGGGTIGLAHFNGTDYFTNGHADYLTKTFTITEAQAEKAGATNPWLAIFNSVPYADGTKFLSIGYWKLEEGSEPTPWSPYIDDTTNIEYDVSGYCNNGTKYNITDYTSDTPRYSVATKFNSSTKSYINIGRGGMVKDEITVNIWAYMDDWTTYNSRLISCTEGGGWNFEPSSSKIHFAIGTGTTSNTYKNSSGYSLADLTSGWHMFTGTYDGLTTKQYVDGVLNTTNNAYTTKTPIFYHASNPILIGTEASSTQNPANYYFNGYMSDIRIYATALSDADILSLYNNSAFLDSSGNMYATEYIEE